MASQVASTRRAPIPAAPRHGMPGIFPEMDDDSTALILRLQMEDIDQMLPIGVVLQEAELTGWQQTLLAQKEELQRILSLIMDTTS